MTSSSSSQHGGASRKRTRDEERVSSSFSSSSSSSFSSSSSKPPHTVINIEEESKLAPTSSSAEADADDSAAAASLLSEYRVWKKNSAFLYDIVLSAELLWPSLTVQWLPDRQSPAGKDVTVQRLLLGTQTDGLEPNYLMIAEVKLPAEDAVIDAAAFSKQEADHEPVTDSSVAAAGGVAAAAEREAGGYGGRSGKVDIVQRIPHPSEVNRARYLPHNPDLIVSRGTEPQLFLFDRTRYASKPQDGDAFRCDVLLDGHTQEGYGLSWSLLDEGRLVSSAGDASIAVWDINAKAEAAVGQGRTDRKAVRPSLLYLAAHSGAANDVAWHQMHPALFASGGDDSVVKCWDARQPALASAATHRLYNHGGPVNSVAFSPLSPYLLASGSDDHSVVVWDVRGSPSRPLHRLRHHRDSVMQVLWSPFDGDVLGSVSADRRVNLYDVSRDGDEEEERKGGERQSSKSGDEEEAEDEDARLLFQHGGHSDKVGEMSWNAVSGEEWMVASVSDDNILQVWQPAENIIGDDDDDDDDNGAVEEQVKRSRPS